MAQTFATYSPSEVSIIAGSLIITGFAQDSMVSVARKTATWESTVGSDGFVTRRKNMDKRGEVTITLDMSSPSNDDLSALFNADEKTGKGVFPIMIRDGSGRSVASAANAWLVQPATMEFGGGVLGRQWTFECDVLAMNVAGNN